MGRLSVVLDSEDAGIGLAMEREGPAQADAQKRMRSALINSATDARLACSIFRTILDANRAVRPQIAPSFQYLKLRCYSGSFGHAFGFVQSCVARNWICERMHADMSSNNVRIHEASVRGRNSVSKIVKKNLEEHFIWCDDWDFCELAWEAVWPEAKGMEDWLNEWHSYPLDMEDFETEQPSRKK
ncbi:hypothetical protein CC80DRAFT_544456 [Byssothecium circinans]|uniref:Uncharacterized protein n=1 Tax=Byssothecium circinans TaxID=147558 RepID=A0A6A5U4D6_9PLEO|nr:hypothetical protein CC80DRAFT_544456 [Byssothecium circinans]